MGVNRFHEVIEHRPRLPPQGLDRRQHPLHVPALVFGDLGRERGPFGALVNGYDKQTCPKRMRLERGVQ
jgi:hypothetical protein